MLFLQFLGSVYRWTESWLFSCLCRNVLFQNATICNSTRVWIIILNRFYKFWINYSCFSQHAGRLDSLSLSHWFDSSSIYLEELYFHKKYLPIHYLYHQLIRIKCMKKGFQPKQCVWFSGYTWQSNGYCDCKIILHSIRYRSM